MRCKKCGRFILLDQPAFHKDGRPVLHRACYSGGYTGEQLRRWQELLADLPIKAGHPLARKMAREVLG